LWTGWVTFGLINVPVRVYSAVHEHRLNFHLVHEPDDGPIGYEKVCKLEDKPVGNDENVRAFEVRKGKYVHLTDEDFDAVRMEGTHTIDLVDFVSYEEIDPTFFAHTYLVGPQERAEKTYALLVRAMERSQLAGIGKFVMRNRQYLGCLRVRDKTLTLEQMHFADEVDKPSGILPARLPSVSNQELEMALALIEQFSSRWQPRKYKDTYTAALKKIVNAKLKGKEVHVAPEPEADDVPDLMEALRLSLQQRKTGSKPTPQRTSQNGGKRNGRSPDLARLTKEQLDRRAQRLGIAGRSKMSKDELVQAIAAAR